MEKPFFNALIDANDWHTRGCTMDATWELEVEAMVVGMWLIPALACQGWSADVTDVDYDL